MAVKYMKKVGIQVIYVKCCQIWKIFTPFIAGSAKYNAKDKS